MSHLAAVRSWMYNWITRAMRRLTSPFIPVLPMLPAEAGPHSFDFLVVGSGGGPFTRHLSSYLLKPAQTQWEDGVIALEAGSGIQDLDALLKADKSLLARHDNQKRHGAAKIYSFIKGFLVTHAHLDHINALVIQGGSLSGSPKYIYALDKTLQDLESHVFNDSIWPNLARWEHADDAGSAQFIYQSLRPDDAYARLGPGNLHLSVRTFLLNHGHISSGTLYLSSGHLIRNNTNGREFFFFGDTGRDSESDDPRLQVVWTVLAPKIAATTLSAIVVECSWPSGRRDEDMYGHFCPQHLYEELVNLASAVVSAMAQREPSPPEATQSNGGHPDQLDDTYDEGDDRPRKRRRRASPPRPKSSADELQGVLHGLKVYVTHFKDVFETTASPDDEQEVPHIRETITGQIRTLVNDAGLGAVIVALTPGMCLRL